MTKIKQYLEENAFSLITVFTSTFVLSEFWVEWMHVTLGLKVWMVIIYLLYIFMGAYVDVLHQTIKRNKKQIIKWFDKSEDLKQELRREQQANVKKGE